MDMYIKTRQYSLVVDLLSLIFVLTELSGSSVVTRAQTSTTEMPMTDPNNEFCQWDTFQPQCPADHVIVITRAQYGRMPRGRCVKRDYGYVGCYSDVRHLAEKRCSGRQQCEIMVPDKQFEDEVNCPDDLKMYLRASYTCVRVVSPSPTRCRGPGPIDLTLPNGTLSSYMTKQTGCGGTNSPWRIQAQKGQKIELTFVDFGRSVAQNRSKTASIGTRGSHCHVYAIVKEVGEEGQKTTPVCGGESRSHTDSFVFVSRGSEIELRIVTSPRNDENGHFLVKYRGINCADPELPPATWWSRDGEKGVMGCQGHVDRKWELVCRGGSWKGRRGNCSDGGSGMTGDVKDGAMARSTFSRASSMLIVMGIAVVIGLLILLVGLVILRRRNKLARRPKHPHIPPMMPPVSKQLDLFVSSPHHTMHYNPSHPPLLKRTTSNSPEENEYAYVEEFQFSAPTSCGCPSSTNHPQGEQQHTIGPYGFFEDGCSNTQSAPNDLENVCAHGDMSTMTSSSRSKKGQSSEGQKSLPKDHPQYFTLDPHTVKISDKNANVAA